jgi:hypothetical protein
VIGPADHGDDGVLEGQRAGGVAGFDRVADDVAGCLEVADEIVRPEHLAARLVERKELLVGASREDPAAGDQRGAVWPWPVVEIHRLGGRGVLVLPQRAA